MLASNLTPFCVFYLYHLIRLNHFQNCQIIPVGIAEKADLCTLLFRQDDDVDSSATFRPERAPERQPIQTLWTPVLPFSLIRERLGIQTIALIKRDVEGAELEVLQSLDNVLRTDRPPLLLEILRGQEGNAIQKERKRRTRQILQQHQYALLAIRVLPRQHARLELLNETADFPNDCQDYLVIPSERLPFFMDA